MTEAEYFDAINDLLAKAKPIGAYCLSFAEVLRRETGRVPPRSMMERLVQCRSVAEGAAIYQQVRNLRVRPDSSGHISKPKGGCS